MDLREKIAKVRAGFDHTNDSKLPVALTTSDCDRLLAALDLQDAVRWCEENEVVIESAYNSDGATRYWSLTHYEDWEGNGEIRGHGATLLEAVNALKAKLDKEKEPTRDALGHQRSDRWRQMTSPRKETPPMSKEKLRKPTRHDPTRYILNAIHRIARDKRRRVLLADDVEWHMTRLREIGRLSNILLRRKALDERKP